MAEIETPLGRDRLLLTSFSVDEHMSLPFEILVGVICEDPNIDFNPALGKQCSVRFRMSQQKKRYFSGMLMEATWTGAHPRGHAYELVLRPWLSLLQHATDSRIFQKMSVIDIIEKVFNDAGFRDFQNDTKENYKKIDYCVQYRESHYNFVNRLMEQFGIYFYFKHTADKHVLVMADGKACHKPVPDLPSIRYVSTGEQIVDGEETLSSWTSGRQFQTGKVVVNAFDFDKPNANLIHEQALPGGYQHDSLEFYNYPETYKQGEDNDLGKKYALAVLQSRQAQDRRRGADGDAPSLFPGGLIKVTNHPAASENKEYVITSVSHTFEGEDFVSGSGGGASGNSYRGRYVLQQSERPFRAPLKTPRPLISGPQTATVVGPDGEEIHTDKHGRIKIKFHWDRKGPRNDQASRWARVGQISSGKKWGGIQIPRIGMEVIVDFLEGDPDRPIVVGTVYNGENPPPYQLPANKTQAGVKTRSTKGGGEDNYNEFLFEDKKGAEFIRLHAEKDMNLTIEDAETRTVKGKNKKDVGETTRETTIEKGDDILTVKTGDSKFKIGRDQKGTVGRDYHLKAESSITLECGSSTIVMKPTTISIKTPSLSISTDNTKIEATIQIEEKAALIKLN